MRWDVEYTDEFGRWWEQLSGEEQSSIAGHVGMLELWGPQLVYPYSSAVSQSRHGHLRELRVQHVGRPYRVLYAFDPRRVAILLIGGEKTGDDRWYDRWVPIADRLYDQHLAAVRKKSIDHG